MARAFLVALCMIAITAVLCVLIYGVMIAIRPIEARQYKKSADIELPMPRSERPGAGVARIG